MKVSKIISEILKEVEAATIKFPTWPTDPNHATSIVMEEAGELDQAVMETIYEFPKSTRDDCAKEAIQTAATCVRFLISLEKYEFKPSAQHFQDDLS